MGPENSDWQQMDLSAGLQTVRDENKTGKVRAALRAFPTHSRQCEAVLYSEIVAVLRAGYESVFAFVK